MPDPESVYQKEIVALMKINGYMEPNQILAIYQALPGWPKTFKPQKQFIYDLREFVRDQIKGIIWVIGREKRRLKTVGLPDIICWKIGDPQIGTELKVDGESKERLQQLVCAAMGAYDIIRRGE